MRNWFLPIIFSVSITLNACSGESIDLDSRDSGGASYPVAKAIDLGLPSGTKWASWNVGATKPEGYGEYYAWGETEEKKYYDWSTYTYRGVILETYHHIGVDIAGTEYDVAHVKWGGLWRMPTIAQQGELLENCTREWTQLNGVNGTLFTGRTATQSSFLPLATAGTAISKTMAWAAISGRRRSSASRTAHTTSASGSTTSVTRALASASSGTLCVLFAHSFRIRSASLK